MNRLKKAIQVLRGKAIPLQMAGPGSFQVVNGQIVWNPTNDKSIIENGYKGNDIVYSIISLITNKARVAPWAVYKIQDESSLKQYNAALEVKDFKKAEALKHKALTLYTVDGKLNELLKYPNDEETWSDLIEQSCGFKLLTGDKYLYGDILEAGANRGKPNSIICLPSHQVNIIAQRTFPAKVVGYQLQYGVIINLADTQVLHEKYWNTDWDVQGSQLYGLSPLRAACRNIQRNNDAKKASVSSFQNGGARGVVYQDDDKLEDTELSVEQAGLLKKKWKDEYGGSDNYNKIIVSPYKIGFAQIGLSPVDLAIIDAEKWDLRMLCNIFGVPSELLNDPDNKSFNNKREAERALTTRCALPLLCSHRDSLNRKLQTDWGYKGTNIYVDFDTSIYSELQENEGDKANWINKSVLTIRQRYELMNIEVPDNIPDEVLDTLLIPTGLQDVDSLGMAVPDISGDAANLGKMKLL